jgi:DNA-binding CsgD family transcriptional regulator/tetratricopeptide (TPR) repeat protein
VLEAGEDSGFVGRATELAALDSTLGAATGGRGQTVIVGGEAGIGKTALLARFADLARPRGIHVLSGSCIEFDAGGPAYGPFLEALRGLLQSLPREQLAAIVGPGRSELSRLLPEIGRTLGGGARDPEPDPNAPARLFEQVLGLFERLAADAPVVLMVEDLQWSDPSTRDLLAFLARSLRRTRSLLIVTARTEELHRYPPVLLFLAELEREPNVRRIELAAFERADLAALIEAALGRRPEAELLDSVAARSGGNPFFAEQLLAATLEGRDTQALPPRLRDVLLARVAGLPEVSREVLRAAAAAGRRTDDALLMAVLDLPDQDVAAGFRELTGRRIMVDADAVPDGRGGYAFRHALLQEVVYAELFPGERQRLHAGFGRALAERGEVGGVPVDAAELAYHWDQARDLARALPALIAAAAAAGAVYAFSEAHRHYERALELWERLPDAGDVAGTDRIALTGRAAEAAVLSGAFRRAIELGRAAIAEARSRPPDDPELLGVLHERLRWYLAEAGDRAAARVAVAEALRLLPAEPPTTARARALGHAGSLELLAGRYAAAEELAAEGLTAARAAGAKAEEALSLGVLGWAEAVTGSQDAGIATFRAAVRIADELGGVEGIAAARSNLSSLLDRVGRTEEALAEAMDGFSVCQRLGVARTYGGTLMGHAAKALLNLGRWPEAAEALDRGLDLDPIGRPAVWLRINQARLDTAMGRFDASALHLQEARDVAQMLGTGDLYHAALLAGVADLAAWRGHLPDLRAAAAEGVTLEADDEAPGPALGWLAAYVLRGEADEAEAAQAHRDEARETDARRHGELVYERLVAGRIGGPDGRRFAIAAMCTAERGRLNGDRDGAAWIAVAEAWDAIQRPYPAAYCRYRAGAAILASRGDRGSAERELLAGWEATVRLGAAPLRADIELLARQARIELPGTGDAVRTEGTAGAASPSRLGLTDREHEVLRLVAGGWSNQQIGDALFISRKTASVHVSNILGKLGAGSRVEAAAVAHRLGLAADAPPPPDSEVAV